KLNRKSDYYVYFFFQGLNLLNKNGTLCFITSSAWLDVAYGRDLQEFFCKYTPIKAIYNTLIRSFKDADINTVITLLGAPIFSDKGYSGQILLRKMGQLQSKVWRNIAKFIDLKKPIDEFLDPKIMLELENVNVVHEGIKYSSLIRNIVENEYYRAFPILQADLLMMGGVDIKNIIHRYYGESDKSDKKDALISVLMDRLKWGNYRLCKWGGLFFRAPDIFFRILSKGGDKLVPLGEIAKIKFGIKTGANDFFYFPNKYFDIILENQKGIKNEDLNYYNYYNYYKLIPKKEGLPSDLRIEAKYLKPLIKSSRDCDHILIDNSFSKYKVLICHKNKSALRELNECVLKYIEWGEGFNLTIRRGFDKGQKLNGFHNIKSVQTRKNWFEIKERPISLNILPMFENERKFCFYNPHRLYIDASLYYVYPKKDIDQYKLNIVLNSTLFALFKEIMARPPEGMGALQIKIYHYQQMPVLNILNEELDIEVPQSYQNFLNREIKSIFDELGFDPDLPIRDQDPKPLPDRAEIDTIIFNKLGLSEDERKDVYWTLAELVKKRLTKAKSLDV
ncbi:MAG: Eco57I restriction-modification methylase domain-containing protein, partial [Promethearchaeota archaeon]